MLSFTSWPCDVCLSTTDFSFLHVGMLTGLAPQKAEAGGSQIEASWDAYVDRL